MPPLHLQTSVLFFLIWCVVNYRFYKIAKIPQQNPFVPWFMFGISFCCQIGFSAVIIIMFIKYYTP